jgi:ribosomal protein L29
MKIKQIAEKTDRELQQLHQELESQLAEAAIELRTKRVTQVKRIHNLKVDTARVLTIMRQRAITKEENRG